MCTYTSTHICIRPTQSIMYVPLQVNTFRKSVLLIVQYKYLKSCSGDFYSPESDPLHKIMRYWFYYSIKVFSFPHDRICQVEMICIGGVPVKNSFSAGPDLNYFYMIHRGGRICVHICTHICIYTHFESLARCVYAQRYIHILMCIYASKYIYIYTYIYIYIQM